jgi:hypothetical protein
MFTKVFIFNGAYFMDVDFSAELPSEEFEPS